jgi:hypothetical protein
MISTVNRSRLISRRSPDTVIPPSGNAIFTASRKRNGVSRSMPLGFIIQFPVRQPFRSCPCGSLKSEWQAVVILIERRLRSLHFPQSVADSFSKLIRALQQSGIFRDQIFRNFSPTFPKRSRANFVAFALEPLQDFSVVTRLVRTWTLHRIDCPLPPYLKARRRDGRAALDDRIAIWVTSLFHPTGCASCVVSSALALDKISAA